MEEKYQVCVVCTGNACRSPFVESVLNVLIAEHDSLNIEVYSRGTLDWGDNPRDREMVEFADHLGFPMEGKTTHMTYESLMKADKIIVFQAEHRDEITKVLHPSHWDRIVLFDMIAFGQLTEVEDPHYQSSAVYLRVVRHLEEGCYNIIKKWLQSPPPKCKE